MHIKRIKTGNAFFLSSILVILLLFYFIVRLLSPSADLYLSMYNTFKSETLRTNSTISISSLDINLDDSSTIAEHQVEAIKNIFNNLTIHIETTSDSKNKKIQFDITINIDETRSTSFSISVDKNYLAFYYDEIMREVIYIDLDFIDEFLGLGISIHDYIDTLLNMEFGSLSSSSVKKIIELLNDHLSFDVDKKQRNSSKYTLTSSEEELRTLLTSVLTVLHLDDSTKDSLTNILNEDMIKRIEYLPEIQLTTLKNKLQSTFISNHNSFNVFSTDISFTMNISTTFHPNPSKVSWLNLTSSSIYLDPLNTSDINDFKKRFLRKLYVLSLKYPEFLELFSSFVFE